MGLRDDAIAKGQAAMAQAESDALGGAFDDGASSVVAGGVSPVQEQADIDAATQPLKDQIAALSLSKSQEDALLAQVESATAALQALFAPPPAPAPAS